MMKRTLALLFALLLCGTSIAQTISAVPLVSARTTTGTLAGVNVSNRGPYRTFQAYGVTTAGAGSATIKVQVSTNVTGGYLDLTDCSLTITLATTIAAGVGAGCAAAQMWPYVRGNVTAISGTGASVNLIMGLPAQ